MQETRQKEMVIPGQLLGEGLKYDGLCYKEGEKVYSLVRGILKRDANNVSVIPFSGPYMPKVGDVVIGTVIEDFGEVYLVDIHSAYYCIVKEERDERGGGRDRRGGRGGGRGGSYERHEKTQYKLGELVNGKIKSVDEVHESQLTGVWKLEGGLTIEVEPKKVPRIIGKTRSMINLIREKTGCNIAVGQNGIIWIRDGKVELAIEAIRKVEEQAHTSGLTDRITRMLNEAIQVQKRSD